MKQPNVVVFICDDLAWGDIAAHGNPYVSTPHLDSLHRASLRLERHCSGPMCSPARASLLTGRYHLRTRVIDTYCGRSIIDPSERTIAHYLAESGYQCGAFGKWHLGDCYPSRACDMGFHYTLMHNAGGIGQPGDHPKNHLRWTTDSYFDPILFENGLPTSTHGYCTDIFTEAAISFIEKNQNKPFFTYIATNTPHTPLIVEDKWTDRYRDMGLCDTFSKVYGMIANIDDNIGRLTTCLKNLNLWNDTIFIFTSDHGPCPSADSPQNGTRFNANLRGKKGTMYEGGIKVPFFISYPAGLGQARSYQRVTSPIDVLPTILSLTNDFRNQDMAIDGLSLTEHINCTKVEASSPSRSIFMQWHRGDIPIKYQNMAVIQDRYKLVRASECSENELYDIIEDPIETNNIAPLFEDIASSMLSEYERWYEDMCTTRGLGSFDQQPIHIGSTRENPTLLTTNDWKLVEDEGWLRQDLRGYWRIKSLSHATYDISVLFEDNCLAEHCVFTVDDMELQTNETNESGWFHFSDVSIPKGFLRVEASCMTKHADPQLYRQRFKTALYISFLRKS